MSDGSTVGGGVHIGFAAARLSGQRPIPREAPPPSSTFVGRAAQVASVLDELAAGMGSLCLWGMGGLGKTTLAKAVAHDPRCEQLFPDGTFWVDLRASDAMSALDRMAASFGFDLSPYKDPGSRTASVRSALRGKRVLIVLDDAVSTEDVEPLRVASEGSAVVVTTRSATVAAAVCDRVVPIDPLGIAEAAGLLARLAGTPASESDLPARVRIAEFLGGLPLALSLVGRRAGLSRGKKWFSWSGLADELKDEEERLDLSLQNRGVRSSFNMTFEKSLDGTGRERFAWLGLFEPGEIGLPVIARAWRTSDEDADKAIEELCDASLVLRTGEAAFRLHPLLRDFAREKLRGMPGAEVADGHRRVADYLLTHAEETWKKPRSVADLAEVFSGLYHAHAADDHHRFDRVYRSFPPPSRDGKAHADQVAILPFLIQSGHLLKLIELQGMEVDLVRTRSAINRAFATYSLGNYLCDAGRTDEGVKAIEEALRIADDGQETMAGNWHSIAVSKFANRLGEACLARNKAGDAARAKSLFEQCAQLARSRGDLPELARALCYMGDVCILLGPGHETDAADAYAEADRVAAEGGIWCLRERMIAKLHIAKHAEGPVRRRQLDELLVLMGELADPAGPALKWMTPTDGACQLTRLGRQYGELEIREQSFSIAPVFACFWHALRLLSTETSPVQETTTLIEMAEFLRDYCRHVGSPAGELIALACLTRAEELTRAMETPPTDPDIIRGWRSFADTDDARARITAAAGDLRGFIVKELEGLAAAEIVLIPDKPGR